MIMCVGDSLTYGSVGYSYIRFLSGIKAVNKGVNGDMIHGAFARLTKYLTQPKYKNIDTYVIAIGTNDLFQPYLTTMSALWYVYMKPRCALKHCITDDDAFKAAYEDYLKLLTQHHKKGILIGIPLIQVEGFPLKHAQRRNQIVADLAAQYQMPFIDIYQMQAAVFSPGAAVYSWKHKSLTRVLDAAVMLLFPFTKDAFSRRRHLELTVDGVHFNSLSARLLADAVRKAIHF